ncbi:hypothetical protein DUI87_01628 [Hirundo rustica rustica]|uniref:ribonuclease H n=1 Tax=Hirundo rustica rustica TaxID=333673 RepID=A0A3M0L720_HIRRU|nr:hypothetical protein DUI87_01628 [Hirundo rustica rustica]
MGLPPSSLIPTLAPVTYRSSCGGQNTKAIYHPFPQATIRDLCKAPKEYGKDSPYFWGLLKADLSGAETLPADSKQLFSCLLNSTEYRLWEGAWKQLLRNALPGLLDNMETMVDGHGNPLTFEHLAGEGQWMEATDQVALPQKYLNVGQSESFTDFVEKLSRAIEVQVKSEGARTLVGERPDGPVGGVTIDIPDPSQDFWVATTEERPTHKLNWKTDAPVWVEQWPLSKQKLKALEELVEEQLAKGHIVETTSPWNSPVFVIQKPGKDKWRLLQDLRQINNVVEDMGSLQPGMPSPTMLPQNWKLAVIDIKDCFFHIPLHPDDAPCFAFSVPTINQEAPRKRYDWCVLPQGLKVSLIICQWYVASLLSPVRVAAEKAIIHHYMDDVLVCAPTDDVLSHALDLTINALVVAGFELQEEKVQKMPPWKYLGLEIVPQKLEIKAKIETLADVHQLCGALYWVRPWLGGLTTEDLAPLFNLLKGGEELSSPRELTPEAKDALEKVRHLMSTRQAHRCDPDLPFKFIIMGNLPHLHGVIFQWKNNTEKDQSREDPLLIIEWVFLSHHRSKRMTRPQELVAELIWKARVRIRELAGCDFECIHIPIGLRSGQITKAMLEHRLQVNEALQFALDSFTGQISIHRPAHKIFHQDAKFTLSLKSVPSRKPLEALTIFTDTSGRSHKSVMTWKDPQTQQWEADVAEV